MDLPIKCRAAMLELDLTHDGMAELLGVDRVLIVKLCVGDGDIPRHLDRKIRVLLGVQKTALTQRPIMEMVEELLHELYRLGGAMNYQTVADDFGLTERQLKNIELNERWVTIVWEEVHKRYGVYPVVYLCAEGYKKLGVVMSATAPVPSPKSRAMVTNHLNDEQKLLLAAIDKQSSIILEMHDNLKTMRALLVTGYSSPEHIMDLYGRLMEGVEIEPLRIETRNEHEN